MDTHLIRIGLTGLFFSFPTSYFCYRLVSAKFLTKKSRVASSLGWRNYVRFASILQSYELYSDSF
jgi:hypothetical protein